MIAASGSKKIFDRSALKNVRLVPVEPDVKCAQTRKMSLCGVCANARTAKNSLSRITLDDNQSAQNPEFLRHPNGAAFSTSNRFRGGDLVTNTVGVLGFDFNLYRIFPTGPATYTSVNPRPAAPSPVGGTLRVAAQNTLNFFLTLDTLGSILLVPASYLGLNLLEEYVCVPLIIGRRLMLNPVVLFIWLIFWGWLWSVPGALMAVPLLAIVKIVCDHVKPLAAVAEFLGD